MACQSAAAVIMIFFVLSLASPVVLAWVVPYDTSAQVTRHYASSPFLPSFLLKTRSEPISFKPSFSTRLAVGGFGGSGGESQGTKKKSGASSSSKESKLKPKQQWDRYVDLKGSDKVRVGVRVKPVGDDTSSSWLEVGNVKSASDVSTEVAVTRQRALIAEHAKRLFPLQLSSKDTLEWGYLQANDEWVVVDKSVLDTVGSSSGMEKKIGFEGTPDPTTGYYCVYNEGRLVSGSDKDGGPVLKPSSKRLQ